MEEICNRWIIRYCLLGIFLFQGGGAGSGNIPANGMKLHMPEEIKSRSVEPPDSIAAYILQVLPRYMAEQDIPGCAIALIQDSILAWSEGFGKMNSLTGRAVEKETLFEVASNSKIITAYLALRLVEEGMLELDAPLNDYLSEPWLPDPAYRDSITLRHVLSHSSGLGHNGARREVNFSPGSGFYYSNLGFNYLQDVIENVLDLSLEEAAGEWVFEPLEMNSTSYVNPKELRGRLANGHINGSYTGGMAAILLLVPLVLLWLPGLLIHRLVRKRWRPGKRTVWGGVILSLFLWIASLFTLFGLAGWFKYAWLVVLFGFAFILAVSLLIFISKAFNRRVIRWIWTVLVILCTAWITTRIHNIPVPKWPAIRPMAPASLRTTAPDMANFLQELSRPVLLVDSLASEMIEPQIRLHPKISWGLGMGIFHSEEGDALWQWGQNVDFLSFTIIYPDKGYGAVVLTNSDWNRPDVAIDIAEMLLGGELDPVVKASHLEFNTTIGE